MATTLSTPTKSARRRSSEGWGGVVRFVLSVALMGLFLRSFVVMPRSIPSESMMPRLLVGDYLMVAKWPYGFSRFSLPWAPPGPHGRLLAMSPQRGDVVVFRAPPDDKSDYIKRLIGLPGDRIQMKAGQLWLNGKPVPKVRESDFVIPMVANTECSTIANVQTPYGPGANFEGKTTCRFARYRETLPGGASYDVLDQGDTSQDDTPEFVVPTDHYFVMGDNRDESADSRFPAVPGQGVGFVPAENLEGRALFTIWSTDGSSHWTNPASWWHALRPDRIGHGFR